MTTLEKIPGAVTKLISLYMNLEYETSSDLKFL